MVQQQNQSSRGRAVSDKANREMKYVISFIFMILLTAAAFYLVSTGAVAEHLILPLILILATIQVFLQLFTFMHLDQKGTAFYTIFIIAGIFFAAVCVVGIVLM
ncbi:cytochrome C oxidase subunit IV family protein [Thermoactinomyces mirandus]|uniref:Cytochrome C oxidase subunit IV family protein n=1 Tax=Thermoactinomyces mirandus TaxID=2756294 RepID=A0A7W1XQB0_9BACL|nr:cytochrome C oxidase subunit IV family protein [Thermoactinomyces mirandus]MBA4601090.1 cytochrome C oxidase subunit IV family protein [Thermoactinomyces mirandus]